MNRGSTSFRRIPPTRNSAFNEAPIHESGKSGQAARDARGALYLQ